jgi:hypothetical protein
MWPITAEDRLREWYLLRTQAVSLPLEECLIAINDWWANAPQNKRHLNWWEMHDWPTPWDLLAENVYCDLAQALGIVYTLMMLQREDISDILLAQTRNDNLVLVDSGKYILNWGPGQVLNIQSQNFHILRTVSSTQFNIKIR